MNSPLEKLLGSKLVLADQEIETSTLTGKNIVLYFSAHWCPPCRGFTPRLASSYKEYTESNNGNVDSVLIFVSSDRDKAAFDEYRAEMSFYALPFDPPQSQTLGQKFGVQGIPSLVAIDSEGNTTSESLDLRRLIAIHGSNAFPLTEEHAKELEKEEEKKKQQVLKRLGDGTISFEAKATSDATKVVSLKDLIKENDHVALLLGDGDNSDQTYQAAKRCFEAVTKEKGAACKVVYLGWSLYNDQSNHETLGAIFDYSANVDESLRSAVNSLLGGQANAGTLVVLRQGTGLCDMKGNCEEAGVPVIVMSDPGLRKMLSSGPPAFPWDTAALQAFEKAKNANQGELKSKLNDMNAFLKSVKLVGSKNGWKDLEDENAVIGFYFSAHWCPPCQMFTPKLVSVYEEIRAAGKPFELVFLSSDRSESEFASYFDSMKTKSGEQFYALDYNEHRDLKGDLSKLFDVSGIPSLIFLRKDGTVLTRDGREAVMTGGKDSTVFPWNA